MVEPKVGIILPSSFWERTKYRFLETLKIKGIVVPEGFITDGASVPRFLWWLFPPVGRYFITAAYHDRLVREGWVSRANADKRFYVAMKKLGIWKWVAVVLWKGAEVGTLAKRYLKLDLGG